jgi:hypothetical protein
MRHLYLLVAFLFMASTQQLSAQTRFYDQVFPNVTVTTGQTYGVNATVLYFSAFNQAVPELLKFDFYAPTGDTASTRPLVLYFHTGNFLPFFNPATMAPGANGSCGGTKNDSVAVEICTRLAKMGYAVASVDYRLGWNPLAMPDVSRRFGIINAAYRGIQDLRTSVRYFKKSVVEAGNPWKVDTSRIVVFGQGTGGYLTLNSVALQNYLQIPTSSGGKFIYDHDANPATAPIPMVIEQVNGDIYGTSVGQVPNAAAPNGIDTLCYPNHVGYSSNFRLSVNLAGALADSTWVLPGQVPQLSFHVPTDNFAPYNTGIVNVPGTNLQVVDVVGSYWVQHKAETLGNQAIITGIPAATYLKYEDNQAAAFANSPAGVKSPAAGLYPFNMPSDASGLPTTTAPWEWTGYVPMAPATCNNDKSVAIAYIDTIMGFYSGRACYALGLVDCVNRLVGTKTVLDASSVALEMFPNPVSDILNVRSGDQFPIQRVRLFDGQGRLVRSMESVNQSNLTIAVSDLTIGYYVLVTDFEHGGVAQEVMIQR